MSYILNRFLPVLCLALPVALSHGQTQEELAQIEAALPTEAPAQSKQPRKVLVFTLTKGFRHDSIPHGEKALQLLGEKTGAYQATITQDESAISADNLKQYDAIIFCNNTGELFTDTAQRKALISFVRDGKGIVGIHAATDCCYKWAPYGEMLGGYFDGHPWNAGDTVTLKIEDTTHPVMAAFPGRTYTVTDEIYQLKDPYSRENLNVLASLDTALTDMTKPGIKRADQDFPVAWVRNFGKGRVFYCSLGHNKHIYWNPVILKHYLAGIQFALGDLEADASPDQPDDQASLEQMLPGLVANAAQTTYSGKMSNHPDLELYLQRARAFPATRARAAEQLSNQLKALADQVTTETIVSLQFLGQKLGEIGTETNVPALAELLTHSNPEVVETARKALERIPGDAASAALVDGLKQAKGETRIGFVNSLGERQESTAQESLASLLKDDDPGVVSAAASALGKIPTVAAAYALQRAFLEEKTTAGRAIFADAALNCSTLLYERGAREPAGQLSMELFRSGHLDDSRRAAALIVMVKADPTHNIGIAVQQLLNGDGLIRQAAAGLLAHHKGNDVPARLIRSMNDASPEIQADIIELLAYRGDREALELVREAKQAEDVTVRVAALTAMGKLGRAEDVSRLVQVAASDDEASRQAARNSLAILGAPGVDTIIRSNLASRRPASSSDDQSAAAARTELIKAVAARYDTKSVPALLKIASEDSQPSAVASEAFKALAELVGPDQAAPLLDILVQLKDQRVLREAERAALAAIRQIEDEAARPKVILDRMKVASTPEAKAALVRTLGNFGGPDALAMLGSLVKEGESDAVRDAAVRALANFPTADALMDVREIARTSQNLVHQALATRGYARLLALPSERPHEETLRYATEALELAGGTEDKRLVISELGGLQLYGVSPLIQPYLENAELREDAMAALARLALAEAALHQQETIALLQRIQTESTSEETRKLAAKQAREINKLKGYLTGWEVSGPYVPANNVRVTRMLDMQFPPEDAATSSTWTIVAAGTNGKHPEQIDLLKVLGGTERLAYLRTRVWSDANTSAVLELGNDDGLRVWLNGQVVHSDPATGPYAPKEASVNVDLRAGWNYVLMKVTQGSGDWAASVRLATPDGKALEGVRQSIADVDSQAPFLTVAHSQ